MKANEVLKQQHQDIDALFERITLAEGDELRSLRAELASTLFAHGDIERMIFYPASREAIGAAFQIQTSLAEHELIDYTLHKWLAADPNDERFLATVSVLKDLVQRHVEDEEDQLFKQADEAMSEEQLEELGDQMEARYEEVRAGDVEALVAEAVRAAMPSARRAAPRKATKRAPAKRAQAKRAPTKRAPAKRAQAKRAPAKRAPAKRGEARAPAKARPSVGGKKAAQPPAAKPARPTAGRKGARPAKGGRKGGRSTSAAR